VEHAIDQEKQIAEPSLFECGGYGRFAFAQANRGIVNMRMHGRGARRRRVRLDGGDAKWLLFAEPSEIQANFEWTEINFFQRNRFGRDVDLRAVDGDRSEFLLGGQQLRVELGNLRQLSPVRRLESITERAELSEQRVEIRRQPFPLSRLGATPLFAGRNSATSCAFQHVIPSPTSRRIGLASRPLPPVGRVDPLRRSPELCIPIHSSTP